MSLFQLEPCKHGISDSVRIMRRTRVEDFEAGTVWERITYWCEVHGGNPGSHSIEYPLSRPQFTGSEKGSE
jgi:hypothetical protein